MKTLEDTLLEVLHKTLPEWGEIVDESHRKGISETELKRMVYLHTDRGLVRESLMLMIEKKFRP